MGKQSQLLLKPTEVEFGWQVGVEFDKNKTHLTTLGIRSVLIGNKIASFTSLVLMLNVTALITSWPGTANTMLSIQDG